MPCGTGMNDPEEKEDNLEGRCLQATDVDFLSEGAEALR